MGAFLSIALAIAILCLCPPDKSTPLSPTIVSNPFSYDSIKSRAYAVFAASTISDSDFVSSNPYAILFLIVSLNRVRS